MIDACVVSASWSSELVVSWLEGEKACLLAEVLGELKSLMELIERHTVVSALLQKKVSQKCKAKTGDNIDRKE